MTDIPAFVNNRRLDVMAANPLAEALYAPLFADPTRPANHARFAFLNPRAHDFWIDWDRIADDTVAVLRTEAGRDPYDKTLADLVGELCTRSDAFRTRWASHNVRLHRTGLKHYQHPVVGALHLNFESMELAADAGVTVTMLSAQAGSPADDNLRLLSSWAATPSTGRRPHRSGAELMNPTYEFRDQVALVTGAASGIGLATATAFAESGAAVVLADFNEQALRAATDKLTAAGHRVTGVTCDVSDEGQTAAMVARAVGEYGRLDMAFNNAGVQAPPSDAADELAENFDRVTAINLRGVWASMKHELHHMRDQGSGAIVNCSSLGGLVGMPSRAAYHAAKHGVIGLTKSAALEYASCGIRINAVCPGVILTGMSADMMETQADAMTEILKDQPTGRIGRADEVAAAVLWLCSPAASFVIAVALPFDGGFTAH